MDPVPNDDLISSYIPSISNDNDSYSTSSLSLLQATFESAKFWLHCAENACQRTAQYDRSIRSNFQDSVQTALRQFIAAMKDASRKCIDDATRYLPELTENPASLMPPVEDLNESFDVKPDRKTLEQALLPSIDTKSKNHSDNEDVLEDVTDVPYGLDYDMDVNDHDDDDDDDDYMINKNMKKKSRKRRKMQDDTFKCAECDIEFANKDDMMSHIELAHIQKASRVCPICTKTFSTPKAVRKHIKEVHDKRQECHICGKKFAYKHELDKHVNRHMDKSAKKDDGVLKTYSCQICGFHAKRMPHVKAHIRYKHAEWLQEGAQTSEFVETVSGDQHYQPNTENDVGDFSCLICNRNFAMKRTLHTHLKIHLKDQSTVKDGAGRCFICTQCHKRCTSRKALFAHIKRVHSKSMKCKFCHKTFFARYQLEGHLRMHLSQKPFQCDMCSRNFSTLTSLRTHTKTKHPDRFAATPYKCHKCDIDFIFKAQLTRHKKRTHASNDGTPVKATKKVAKENLELCKGCGRGFSTNRLLWEHIQRVHGKKFTCKTCGKKFGHPIELRDHEMFHSNKNAYACDFCETRCHTTALIVKHATQKHPSDIIQARFPCNICQASFPLSVTLHHHLLSHAPYNRSQIPCDICLSTFPTQLRLKTHKMVAHEADSDMYFQDSDPPLVKNEYPDMSMRETVVCQKCGLEFHSMNALSKHKTVEHQNDPRLQCPACDKICGNKEALRSHKRRVHGVKRECSICNKKFPFQYALDAHILTHTGTRNFTCDFCKKQFYTITQLNVHKKFVHSEKTFPCEWCGMKFGTKHGRDRHIQHRHTKERPHTCEFCGRGFVDRSSLKSHIFIHTRQSDIKCDQCHKLFGTRSILNKHIRVKHQGERKLCPICGKHVAGSIGNHLKSHGEKRYKCDQCDKTYSYPQGLTEHLRTHSGSKPYECPICHKRFLGSSNFSKHKKIHTKDEVPRRKKEPEKQEPVEPTVSAASEEPSREADFHNQYQAVMNQSINQLMMTPGMMNPSMMNQSVFNQMQMHHDMKIHPKEEMPRRRTHPEKQEAPEVHHSEHPSREADFHNQYQAVMNQSINQFMMNPGMMNPSVMNQSVFNQMHHDMNPTNMP